MNKLFLFVLMFLGNAPAGLRVLPEAGITKTPYFPFEKAAPADTLQNVLFATNEDLELFIDDEPKGTLSKKAHLYLKLPPGRHVYRARSKTATGELRETFVVREGAANEVFIDFLYFLDENKAASQTVPAGNNAIAAPASIKTDTTAVAAKQAEAAVISSLAANMAAIEGGRFIMGNNNAPAADEQEHGVTLSGFSMGRHEVTQQQWETIMGFNPSKNKGCPNCPVENVSWEDVMRFIRKINIAGNKKFRLPTEAEWEYVAKLGGKAEVDKAGGQEEYIKKTAWFAGNAGKKTQPVGQKQPNVAGVYDLMGNVAEWCADWYGTYYYKDDDSQVNPEGPPLGKEKVVRGGSFLDYQGDRFRPSFRDKKNPTTRSEHIGFRLVLEGD